jgi:hypothetical protein
MSSRFVPCAVRLMEKLAKPTHEPALEVVDRHPFLEKRHQTIFEMSFNNIPQPSKETNSNDPPKYLL